MDCDLLLLLSLLESQGKLYWVGRSVYIPSSSRHSIYISSSSTGVALGVALSVPLGAALGGLVAQDTASTSLVAQDTACIPLELTLCCVRHGI